VSRDQAAAAAAAPSIGDNQDAERASLNSHLLLSSHPSRKMGSGRADTGE